uniref:hypothetical protein n=1 Tax=Lactobacillus acidophilus TaxID=1579 RepID=UPI003F54F7E4
MKSKETPIVPSNSWRTSDWIQKAYGLSRTSYYELRQECLVSEYKDAVIQINSHKTFIRENRWQEFLENLSDKFLAERYGI